jgi:predicted nucleic acid-binding protein
MKVIADTPLWSLLLRRPSSAPESPFIAELKTLTSAGRIVLLGPIRQEVLSGIRHPAQFEKARQELRHFADLPLELYDYESAAEAYNTCHSHGIQGSHTDFLLCVVARRYDMSIFTTDKDFARYAKHLKIRLHPLPV